MAVRWKDVRLTLGGLGRAFKGGKSGWEVKRNLDLSSLKLCAKFQLPVPNTHILFYFTFYFFPNTGILDRKK